MQLIARYRGMLPCADCSGIDTELALYAKSPNEALNTRYVLKRTYMKGRGTGKSFAESGTWTLMRGTPDDSNATVYQLKDNKTGDLTNFLKVGANQLEQLDKDQHRIDTKLNLRLTKVRLRTRESRLAELRCKRGQSRYSRGKKWAVRCLRVPQWEGVRRVGAVQGAVFIQEVGSKSRILC